jgi:hypothetical protein
MRLLTKNRTKQKFIGYGPKRPTFLCSYPKSGRTWLRFILANYFASLYELNLEIDFHTLFTVIPNDDDHQGRGRSAYQYERDDHVPLVVSSHASYRHQFRKHNIIFILRSPLDVIVSCYFHDSRQWKSYRGDIKNYLRDTKTGVERLIAYLNSWSDALPHHRAVILSYEQLTRHTEVSVVRALEFLGVAIVDRLLREAIEKSAMERMRELEIARGIPGHRYDRTDQNALRVRSGKIGGYRDYLDSEDEQWVSERCHEALSPASKKLLTELQIMP